jgi:hypothetical protein
LAYLLRRNQQREAAVRHLLQALQHDPTLVPARRMLAELGGPGRPDFAARPSGVSPTAGVGTLSPPATHRSAWGSSWTPESPVSPASAAQQPTSVRVRLGDARAPSAAASGYRPAPRVADSEPLRLPPPVVELRR